MPHGVCITAGIVIWRYLIWAGVLNNSYFHRSFHLTWSMLTSWPAGSRVCHPVSLSPRWPYTLITSPPPLPKWLGSPIGEYNEEDKNHRLMILTQWLSSPIGDSSSVSYDHRRWGDTAIFTQTLMYDVEWCVQAVLVSGCGVRDYSSVMRWMVVVVMCVRHDVIVCQFCWIVRRRRRHIVHRMSAGLVDSIRGVGRRLSQSWCVVNRTPWWDHATRWRRTSDGRWR